MFVQVDFGLVRSAAGALEPKLVELQAFPSSTDIRLRRRISTWRRTASHATWESISAAAIAKLIGGSCGSLSSAGHDPENVILMEIDPEQPEDAARLSDHAARS